MNNNEKEFVLDENNIKSMTAEFIESYKSRLTEKSLKDISYVDDICEAYARGVHNGCMLILDILKETTAEVNANG